MSRHGCKNVGSDAKDQYKQNELKITKETLISNFAAVVCVYWYTGLPLVCNIKLFALKCCR